MAKPFNFLKYHKRDIRLQDATIPALTPESKQSVVSSYLTWRHLDFFFFFQMSVEPGFIPMSKATYTLASVEMRCGARCVVRWPQRGLVCLTQSVGASCLVSRDVSFFSSVRRSATLRSYAGDTSLPGGKVDPGDRTFEDTAASLSFSHYHPVSLCSLLASVERPMRKYGKFSVVCGSNSDRTPVDRAPAGYGKSSATVCSRAVRIKRRA
jgi:hypothetical protein